MCLRLDTLPLLRLFDGNLSQIINIETREGRRVLLGLLFIGRDTREKGQSRKISASMVNRLTAFSLVGAE